MQFNNTFVFSAVMDAFQVGIQHDAHEFLTCVLNGMFSSLHVDNHSSSELDTLHSHMLCTQDNLGEHDLD